MFQDHLKREGRTYFSFQVVWNTGYRQQAFVSVVPIRQKVTIVLTRAHRGIFTVSRWASAPHLLSKAWFSSNHNSSPIIGHDRVRLSIEIQLMNFSTLFAAVATVIGNFNLCCQATDSESFFFNWKPRVNQDDPEACRF